MTLDLEEGKGYHGVLKKPAGDGIVKGWFSKGSEAYGGDLRLTVDWELPAKNGQQPQRARDWISIRMANNPQTGKPSKLRQLLNALAEKDIETDLWFDKDTLEWGYDVADPENDTPYAVLHEDMDVMFKGEFRKAVKGGKRYVITAYKQFKPAVGKKRITPKEEPPIDVDPDEIPF